MKDTAVLLIDCPDRKGLVAGVAGLLYQRGANILHADQHQDHELGLFFMRVEWALNTQADTPIDAPVDGAEEDLSGPGSPIAGAASSPASTPASSPDAFDLEGFRSAFSPLAAELGMRWKLSSSARKLKVALFCSQYLHCMADL